MKKGTKVFLALAVVQTFFLSGEVAFAAEYNGPTLSFPTNTGKADKTMSNKYEQNMTDLTVNITTSNVTFVTGGTFLTIPGEPTTGATKIEWNNENAPTQVHYTGLSIPYGGLFELGLAFSALDVNYTITPSYSSPVVPPPPSVPLPSTAYLLGSSLVALVSLGRRKA